MANKYICIIIGLIFLVVSPVLADEPVNINGEFYHNHSYMEGAYTSYLGEPPETTPSLPVPAPMWMPIITYPEEYYTLKQLENAYEIGGVGWDWQQAENTAIAALELRRHTILLEKQNELLAEQNHIAWIQACYVPHEAYAISSYARNISALKRECRAAGYPTETWN